MESIQRLLRPNQSGESPSWIEESKPQGNVTSPIAHVSDLILPVHVTRVSVSVLGDLVKKRYKNVQSCSIGLCISIHLADRYAAR
jgi:hypothetical protein